VIHQDQLAPGSATHILVVEDDDAVGDMLTMLLEGEGYDVTLVRTAQAALHMLLPVQIECGASHHVSVATEPRPAMVLLDLHLPDMSGEELIEHVAIHDIPPIIVLSAKPDYALEAATALQHVRRVLAKPFPVDDLLDQIRTVLA
jgi:two-component system response regulator MtrA